MNIFYLDECPIESAKLMCNKHMSKMVVESAQMLSTAHRMLDGIKEMRPSRSGKRMVPYYKLNDWREDKLYNAVHFNHPCNIWIRENIENYVWLYEHFIALGDEFTRRYNKKHMTIEKLRDVLIVLPKNIKDGTITEPALAMTARPECIVKGNPVKSYRNFYITKQERFKMIWPEGEQPEWFVRYG